MHRLQEALTTVAFGNGEGELGQGENGSSLSADEVASIRSITARVTTQLSMSLKRAEIVASRAHDYDLHELLVAEKVDFRCTGMHVSIAFSFSILKTFRVSSHSSAVIANAVQGWGICI